MKLRLTILSLLLLLLLPAWAQSDSHSVHYARLYVRATEGGQIYVPELAYYNATGGVKVPATPKVADYVSYQMFDFNCITPTGYTASPRLFIYAKPAAGYQFVDIVNQDGESMGWIKHTKANLYYKDYSFSGGYNPGEMAEYPIEEQLRVVFARVVGSNQYVSYTALYPPVEGGSYTITQPDATVVESSDYMAIGVVSSGQSLSLSATPAPGYEFVGWCTRPAILESDGIDDIWVIDESAEETFCSFSARTSIFCAGDQAVYPKFSPIADTTTPLFAVGDRVFSSISEAVNYAQQNGYDKIVLIRSGVLSEDAVIPFGFTLIIPHDGQLLGYTYWVDYGHETLYNGPYRSLTLAAGTTLSVEGTISVSARQTSMAAATCTSTSTVYDRYGLLLLETGAQLLLQPGATLYAYGYVSGDGQVVAQDGATIYEDFQIMDWRGYSYLSQSLNAQMSRYQASLEAFDAAYTSFQSGSITWDSVMHTLTYPTKGFQYVTIDNQRKLLPIPYAADMVFPLNQYYVQNIECRTIFHSGAIEKVSATLSAASQDVHFDPFVLIGSDDGLFRLRDGASLVKWYNCEQDRQVYEVEGQVSIENMHLESRLIKTAFGILTKTPMSAIQSELYNLPIAHNMDIILHDGAVADVMYRLSMLPGSKIQVDEGATLRVGPYAELYVYDTDDWNGHDFAGCGDYIPLEYTHCGGLYSERTPAPDAPGDATLEVAGRLEILSDSISWTTIEENSDYSATWQMELAGVPTDTYSQPTTGGVYTTPGGANIVTTGTIVKDGPCGDTAGVSHQDTNGQTSSTITLTPIGCDEPDDECERTITAHALVQGTGSVTIEIVNE